MLPNKEDSGDEEIQRREGGRGGFIFPTTTNRAHGAFYVREKRGGVAPVVTAEYIPIYSPSPSTSRGSRGVIVAERKARGKKGYRTL